MNIPRLVLFGFAAMLPLSAQMTAALSTAFQPLNIANAPFSATAIVEHAQTLADGTRISQAEEPRVFYRDSAGRTRVESYSHGSRTPEAVTIADPVAGFRYEIFPARQIIKRYTMPAIRQDPPAQAPPPGLVITPDVVGVVYRRKITDGAVRDIGLAEGHYAATYELLAPPTIDGVRAVGERITTTLEAGAVGNDQEIVVTNERWASKELRQLLFSRLSDPRFGDTIRRLANISATEPNPALFVPPADYTVTDK